MRQPLIAAAAVLLLSGCATITTGVSQKVMIHSRPEGATCSVSRDGVKIQQGVTPMTISIDKRNRPLEITCNDATGRQATGSAPAKFQPMFLGNLLVGGFVGFIVDFATGAVSQYETPVVVPFDGIPPAETPRS